MSGLFSVESLALLLPAFVLFKLDKRIKLVHLAFPRYNPNQLEFQFIEIIFKLTAVLTMGACIIGLKWYISSFDLSLLAVLIVCFSCLLIVKFSADLLLMGYHNGVRGRTDPFVVITSFPLAIVVLVQSGHLSDLSPLVFVTTISAIFFACNNTWLAELIESKIDKKPTTVEIVKSSTKNFTRSDIAKDPMAYRVCRLILHGFAPIVLALILFGEYRPLLFSALLLLVACAMLYMSPSLANSWAVFDSVKSSGMPLNQASVLLRFFNLCLPGVFFWLIGVAVILTQLHINHPTLNRSDYINFDSVRDDVERLLVTGDYLDAAKLIRQSGIGTSLISQYLPTVETVSESLSCVACITLTIHASQAFCAVIVRRIKLELLKYM